MAKKKPNQLSRRLAKDTRISNKKIAERAKNSGRTTAEKTAAKKTIKRLTKKGATGHG